MLEDPSEQRSTLNTTQPPVKSSHEAAGMASVGDAICGRIVHASHRIALKGPSMRESRAAKGARAIGDD